MPSLVKVSQDAFTLFQGSSACAWWIWTVQPQQKNMATLFKWYLWSQRAALPKTTWSWASPFRMKHSLLRFATGFLMKAQGMQGVLGVLPEHLKPVQSYRESWKKDTYCVCKRMIGFLEGIPWSLSCQKNYSHWPGFHQQNNFLTHLPDWIVNPSYVLEAFIL